MVTEEDVLLEEILELEAACEFYCSCLPSNCTEDCSIRSDFLRLEALYLYKV